MAANGVAGHAFAPVVAAVETMQSSGHRAQKAEANSFLDKFQKTVSFDDVYLAEDC
jgi:transportin-3